MINKKSKIVKLSIRDNSKKIELNTDQTLQIKVPENLSTGYVWEFVSPFNKNVLELVDDKYLDKDKKEALGARNQRLLIFKSKGIGESKVELKHWQPWSGEDSIIHRFSIYVKVIPNKI